MDQRPRRAPRKYPGMPGETNDPTSSGPNSNSARNPGPPPRINLNDTPPQDFQAVGPAIRLLQLNVEGLSAAKRNIICELAHSHNIDIICLQETHVEDDIADRFTIPDFDLICYDLHAKHGRATYVRSNVTDTVSVQSTVHCDVMRFGNIHIANVYKSPNEKWDRGVLHCHTLLYMWGTLTATTLSGATTHPTKMGNSSWTGQKVTTFM